MDKRIAIGNKIDMIKIESRLSADPNRKPPVYNSQVVDETQDGGCLVSMPTREGKVMPMAVGTVFDATFYTKQGLMRCRVEVVNRYRSGSLLLMEIVQQTELEKVQRREFFRFECHTPMEYRLVDEEEVKLLESGEFYDDSIYQVEWKKAIMLDISGGGVRFACSFNEKPESMIQMRFNITIGEAEEEVCVYATLLRRERSPYNATIYNNHSMFWDMDSAVQERIVRFIFEAQRKQRLHDLGME